MNPMDSITPATSRCGHNFEIPKCPYKHCGARELYEALKELTARFSGPYQSPLWNDAIEAIEKAAPPLAEQLKNRGVSPEGEDPDRPPAEWPAKVDPSPTCSKCAQPQASASPLCRFGNGQHDFKAYEIDDSVPVDPIARYLSILTPEQEGAIEPTSPVFMAMAVGILNAAKELKRIAAAMERRADELHG